MKVILIRSKTTDSAIFKVADSLNENGYDLELLVWDRQNNSTTKKYEMSIQSKQNPNRYYFLTDF